MFGIKTLKKELSKEISELKFEIFKLNNPQKYKVGDIVLIDPKNTLQPDIIKKNDKHVVICDYTVEQICENDDFFIYTYNKEYYTVSLIDDFEHKIDILKSEILGLSDKKINIK
jgi:hypothetical protein